MKRVMIAALLLCGYASSSWAVCQKTSAMYSHDAEVVVDEFFPITQQHTSTMTVTFPGIKCDSASDTISYIPLAKESIIGPFSNGQKLKLTVGVTKTSETIGTTSTTEKVLSYTVTITHASFGTVGTGGDSVYVPGVLVANTGGNSNGWINFILGICRSLSFTGCVDYITKNLEGNSYVENLTVIYRPKQTTCKPDNLTLTLPDISLSELPASGVANGKSQTGDITLQCSELVGATRQTTRGMSVYLYSADLLSGSRSVLQGSQSNGVGFIIENNNKPVLMSTVKGAKDNADSLWRVTKGASLGAQGVSIPLKASYYVYDRQQVQPGALQATALIFVNYE